MVYRGKDRRMGRGYAKMQNWKKAVVTLAEGQNIDFFAETSESRAMGIKNYKPTSPARRYYSGYDFKELTKGNKPERSLTEHQTSTGGRNAHGRITAASAAAATSSATASSIGAATRSAFPAVVASIEYDPNRTARIALLHYADGEKRYILARTGSRLVTTSSRAATRTSSPATRCRFVTSRSGRRSTTSRCGRARALSSFARRAPARLMAKDGDYAQVRMPSGEVRMIHLDCRATVGQVSNIDHANISIGKAGRSRWLGRRPHNRGVTMNPVDHPMGGGEGRTSGGRHPCSPWGQLAKGLKTRNNKRTDGDDREAPGPEGLRVKGNHASFNQEGCFRRRSSHGEDRRRPGDAVARRSSRPGRAAARSFRRPSASRSRSTTAASSSRCS